MSIQAHAQFLFHDSLWIIQVIKQLQKVIGSEYHTAKDTDPFVQVLGLIKVEQNILNLFWDVIG